MYLILEVIFNLSRFRFKYTIVGNIILSDSFKRKSSLQKRQRSI